MGLITAQIELTNGRDLILLKEAIIKKEDVHRANVTALVDTGAYLLCINEHLKAQLDLPKFDEISVEFADSTIRRMERVGPIELRFENRKTLTTAVVLPGDSEVLLGSIPLEDLDIVINPKTETIEVNPISPYLKRHKIK